MPKKQLQLVGVTAMFLASKYEEMYPPEIADFAYVTDRAYTTSQIRDMEMKILRVLKFKLGRPLPLQFLRRASKICEVCKRPVALFSPLVGFCLGSHVSRCRPPQGDGRAAHTGKILSGAHHDRLRDGSLPSVNGGVCSFGPDAQDPERW